MSLLLALCACAYFNSTADADKTSADSSGWAQMNAPIPTVVAVKNLAKSVVIQKSDVKAKTMRNVDRAIDAFETVDEVVGHTTLAKIAKDAVITHPQISEKSTPAAGVSKRKK
jgi:flagella basal body P-ring formation protein FlgA